ncbi:MAG: RNA-binding cell elongation regulator Jag/EloR [Clostridia bacterium]|nr:RNA-binding cell elongation regulator Jag/EloR [Clostridia bacterium]
MRTLDATGKSIDEAIFNGLRELEISIDEVDIEILQQESKGVLGFGVKPAIVRLIEREPESITVPEYLTEEAKQRREERAKQPRERRPRRDDRPRDDRRNDRPRDDRPRNERPNGETLSRAERPLTDENGDRLNSRGEYVIGRRNDRPRREEETFAPIAPKEQIDYTVEAAKSCEGAIFLKGLLDAMGIENAEVLANVSYQEEEDIALTRLRINAEHMGVLIGHRGETLDALQYLTSLHVNRSRKEKGYTRVTIDTEGYRDKREDTLVRLARKVASQVKATGRPRALEPMNPYERRVLHATLQSNPYVTTHSEGEEPYRRVVVEPKGR